MLKNLYLFLLILILFFCTGFSNPVVDISLSYQPNVDRLDKMFREYLPVKKDDIIFTKVPRGLIVSINEDCFFNEGEARIKESSLCLLDTIILLLKQLPNYCVVENHTEENSNDDENWELSLERSDNIVEYMITYGALPSSQLFALGYGQYMPFRGNVEHTEGLDSIDKESLKYSYNNKKINNRVDFVILEYEARR